jgi:hypothetical protein
VRVDLIRGERRRGEGNGIEEWNKKKEMNRRRRGGRAEGGEGFGRKPQSPAHFAPSPLAYV